MSYPIPKAAADAFGDDKNWDNAGLVFDRFSPDVSAEAKRDYPRGSNPKKEGLERVRDSRRDTALRNAMLLRWRETVQSAGAITLSLQTDWRFLSGVGRNTPYEVGFRFDRYGFAALPGSSVKGLARAYAWANGQEATSEFLAVFGHAPTSAGDVRAAQTGRAIFYDAMPVDDPALELDVMNPHFPDYYAGKVPPTNWQSPMPIYFLTVKAGVRFEFAVGWRGAPDSPMQQKAMDWLRGGLMELGAGAKTNAGYGYFIESAPMQQTRASEGELKASQTKPATGLKTGSGKLRREGLKKVWVQDGELRIAVMRDQLGTAFDRLPGDKTDVDYEFEDVDGKRRVWKVTKRMTTKGL